MLKKAERRGRPPGSKNKKKVGRPAGVKGLTKSFANMEVGQLRAYINNLEDLLTKKVTQQRQILEGQLAGLQIYTSNGGRANRHARAQNRQAPEASAEVSIQERQETEVDRQRLASRVDAGEMKGTKLTKEDFAIK